MKNTPIEEQSEVVQYPLVKKLADAYNKTNVAYFFRVVQPSGVFLAAIGLVFAAWTVKMSLDDMEESRKVREANLLVSLIERLNVARTMDDGNFATIFDKKKNERKCVEGEEKLSAHAGQVTILERMNSLGLSLREIDAHNVNLVVRRNRHERSPGIDLEGVELINANLSKSYLKRADLSCAKLQYVEFKEACMEKASLKKANLTRANLMDADARRADFSGANLTRARLIRTNLTSVKFRGAIFSKTRLRNADISGADFTRAKGLTQLQLDSACADEDNPPNNLPKDDNKEQLKWKQKQCK